MPGLNPKQEDVDQFVAITQSTPADAQRFLTDGVTLEGAIEDYFASQAAGGTAPTAQDDDDEDDLDAALGGSGARTLSGAKAEPLPAGWGKRSGPRIATLGGSRDESPEEEGGRRGADLYTGGEKSGLAVQNPNDPRGGGGGGRGLVDDILQQARKAAEGRDDDDDEEEAPRAAPRNPWAGLGAGNALGSEDSPSTSTAAPSASSSRMPGAFGTDLPADEPEESVQRRLTFWRDGFSIEDGPLYRYDDPANQELLTAIKGGRAPLQLFNVRFDQPLQIAVEQRTNEDYVPPPKVLKPFSGGGNRLGSPTPVASGAASPAPAPAASAPKSEFKVDDSKPTTSVQVRLADGTRLVARVNLDHTVADLRSFVSASRPDSRAFILQTTFPNRELPDGETIEQAKLQNAVVMQRFA